MLSQQTLCWQIKLKDSIGKGAFGNVYNGLFQRIEEVAVKILPAQEEESWKHEKDLYLLTSMSHSNILGYFLIMLNQIYSPLINKFSFKANINRLFTF